MHMSTKHLVPVDENKGLLSTTLDWWLWGSEGGILGSGRKMCKKNTKTNITIKIIISGCMCRNVCRPSKSEVNNSFILLGK